MANRQMNVQQGGGSLSRVDETMLPKTQMATDVYQNVRILRQPTDIVNPLGSGRKIVFSPPNSGLLNLKQFKIVGDLIIDGRNANRCPFPFKHSTAGADVGVWKWDGTGVDPDPSFPDDGNTTFFNNVNQGLSDPFFFTLIERIVVQAGGTPIIDIRDLNLINHHSLKRRWNSAALAQQKAAYQGYDADNGNRIPGVPYSGFWENYERCYTDGKNNPIDMDIPCESRAVPFIIQPFEFENAFFNTSDGILPTQLMPNITVEIYFADPGQVLHQSVAPNKTYAPFPESLSGRLHYVIQNLKVEALMAGSSSLERALIQQGMSMTFRNYTVYTRDCPSNSERLSFQVPVTQRAVEQVFLIFRNTADLNDITKSGKISSWLNTRRQILSANVRINGIRRYGEDLDSRGMLMELNRLYPESQFSELFMDEQKDWNGSQQMVVFNTQMDYSRELLSGIKTASQTSPLLVDITFTSPLSSQAASSIQVDIIVKHVKWLSVTREAIEIID